MGKGNRSDKNRMESDNPSSMDDTNSSIMYLLEADSSAYEDSEMRGAQIATQHSRVLKKRTVEPPWLQGVKWNTNIKMRYQMPQRILYSTLNMDNKVMKNLQQNELAQTNFAQLLDDISQPQHEEPFDEEADYLFYPGDEAIEDEDKIMGSYEELDMTTSLLEDDGTGGGTADDDGGGGDSTAIWEHGDNDDDSFDTPVNGQSEDEKGITTPTLTDDSKGKISSNGAAEVENMDEDQTTDVAKTNESPKDGSLSSYDASGGEELSTSDNQKQETEDCQSSCSKGSSDLTPSDNRSNEEAGSSHKESDASSKHLKGLPSTTSSNASNEHSSPEDGSPTNTLLSQDFKEFFKKIFVPLKVQVSKKSDMPGMPHWLVEAHLSEKVAMTYKLPTRVLETVLSEDRKRMQNVVQSSTVKQQLLQLLSEVDQHPTNVPMTLCPPTSYLGAIPNSLHHVSAPGPTSGASALALPNITKTDDQMSVTSTTMPIMMSGITMSVKKEDSDQGVAGLEEKLPMFQTTDYSSYTNKKSDSFTGLTESSLKQEGLSSDTNSDPMVGNSLSQSSSDSTVCHKRQISIPAPMPKTADMFFQEWCQALATGVKGQSVEDIIMSKVFISSDSTPNSNLKTASNIFGALE